jgi:hypothetical protein
MNKRTTQGKVAICSIFLTPERKFSCIFFKWCTVNTVRVHTLFCWAKSRTFQGLSRTKNTVFKHLFLSIFIYKTLPFFQVKMPVPSQENDGCPMSVVGNVKTFVAALCFMNIWAISELAKTFFFLSDPWPLCLSHHFFVILYITCHIFSLEKKVRFYIWKCSEKGAWKL